MADRLTDEQLAEFRKTWGLKNSPIALALAELRDLRDLLATPMVCGFDTPSVRGTWVDYEDKPYERDEAIAIGAGFIRAALSIPEKT